MEGIALNSQIRLLTPLLVVSSQVVSARLAGETVSFAAMRREGAMKGVAIDDVGILEGSLDALPRSRRRSALKVQPELRRAFATRALNAVGVHLASQFVHTSLTNLYEDLQFEAFEPTASKRAHAAIQPLIADRMVGEVVCGLVGLADGFEWDPARWIAVLQVARYLLQRHSYCHEVEAVAKACLPSAPDRPLARLRHPQLQDLLDCLCELGADSDRAEAIIALGQAHHAAAQEALARE